LLVAWLAGPRPADAQTDIVREIAVEGTQRIEPETVRSYLLIREGDRFDATRIDRSLKSLYATGLFADVVINRRGDSLVVTVSENPIINRIAFEGNQRINDETLAAEVSLRPRVIYTRSKVQSDVRRIQTLYRRSGRYAASVEPKVIGLSENRVDLVFEIREGEETDIESIRFVGNKAFSDSELRDVVRTQESAWWRFLTSDDTYDPDRLALDQELLRRFYLAEGYADFRVVSANAELTPDNRNFFLTFTVDEGERYSFGKVEVQSTLRGLDPEAVQDSVQTKEGDWYNADDVEKTVEGLADAVGTLGHAFVEVRPRLTRDREARTIAVQYEINEGPRVYVERIDITGNVRTLDKVIRREVRIVEGDPFNTSRLRRSRQRIRNLDYFETVDVDQTPGTAPDKANVNINVKEKSTGSLSLGAGFSTTSGVIGDVTLRESNLLGRGQDLRARVLIAQRDSQINISFTEPYFLDREIAAGLDAFLTQVDRQDESSFDERSVGGAVRAGYPLTEHLRQNWRYSFRQVKIDDVPDTASVFIQQEEGSSNISEIYHSLIYDRRNSRINPTEGYFAQFDIGFAGLGGDVTYVRPVVKGGYYIPLTDSQKWVLAFRGSGGVVDGLGDDVRLFDRFFVGGDDLRGFRNAGIGPRDISTDDALGGEWYYTATAEIEFPLGLPDELPVKGRVFADLGSTGGLPDSISGANVKDTGSLRASIGAGFTWTSPFGPIGIDFGVPVLKEDFDNTEIVRVNLGARF
jgi:outer membrane protein insertion porin family